MMRFKNMLNLFSKTEVQEDKTHPTPPLEREGALDDLNNAEHYPLPQGAREELSCAEHTVKDLFSYLPIHLFTFKKAAFTLAEVLITLGIIGVVAALTLPTLIQNYKKTVYVNQLKKFVSTFEQGLQKMLADEGIERLSDLPDLRTDYYASINATETKAFIDDFLSKGFHVTYKFAQGYVVGSSTGYEHQIQFNDGSALIGLYSYGKNAYHKTAECELIKSKGGTMCSEFMYFFVDVNGVKGPNKGGRDLFSFEVSDEGKLYPYGGKDLALFISPNTSLESNGVYWNSSNPYYGYGCDGNSKMGGCAARIIENGWKMDY